MPHFHTLQVDHLGRFIDFRDISIKKFYNFSSSLFAMQMITQCNWGLIQATFEISLILWLIKLILCCLSSHCVLTHDYTVSIGFGSTKGGAGGFWICPSLKYATGYYYHIHYRRDTVRYYKIETSILSCGNYSNLL